jgi:hypothetical protein
MRKVSIHQPNYIPWLGYFYKISCSDFFVFLDDAQYSNEGMHNFHYIKTPQGLLRLKIPVQQTLGDRINMVRTRDELGWKAKHLKLIESNYKKAKYFEEVFSDLKYLLLQDYASLASLNSEIIRYFSKKFGINVEFFNSSDFDIPKSREEKILDLCQALKAEVYISGTGARSYQKEENFIGRGIQLRYLEYKPFKYMQLWNEFRNNVSIIDYLMNCGYDWSYLMQHQINEKY